ncbi:Myb/SANT-like DNA-binding domain-containing protein [Lactarius pseudohatsudake]|nr:Myb/SANT-like DNA-binding domain-containing protein [Lactarius pseudohatsudake]
MDDKKGTKQDKVSVKWTLADEATLLQTLADEKTKNNWGDNNPKKVAWTACERTLADSERRSGGTPKTAQAIKNRWQRLKQEYDVVKEIRGLSGFGWDSHVCTVTAERDVWDTYIKTLSPNKAKLVKKYRTKPFPLYNAIGDLVDGTRATGKGAFRAGRTSAFEPPSCRARDTTPSDFAIDPALEEISRDMGRVSEDETGTQNKEPGASFFGSDKYSSSEDDATTVTTPAPRLTKRKRVKSAEPPKSAGISSEPLKSRRVTAGQGMSNMADSLRDMVVHMKTRKEGKTSEVPLAQRLPEDPQERVVAILEQDAQFSDEETLEIVGYFMVDRDFARVYATFQSSCMRTGYLLHQLPKFRAVL